MSGGRVVHRQGRLGDVGEPLGVSRREPLRVLRRLDQRRRSRRQLAQGADDLGVAGVADEDDLEAALMVGARLGMHLGDERTCGVEVEQPPRLGIGRNGARHAVCRKDHGSIRFRDLVELFHKNGAFVPKRVDDVAVVDDLVAHIDGRSELLERHLDDLDRPVDPGTEAARSRQQDLEGRTRGCTWVWMSHVGISQWSGWRWSVHLRFACASWPPGDPDAILRFPDNGQ